MWRIAWTCRKFAMMAVSIAKGWKRKSSEGSPRILANGSLFWVVNKGGVWNVLAKFQTCFSREHEIEAESETDTDHITAASGLRAELFSQPLDLEPFMTKATPPTRYHLASGGPWPPRRPLTRHAQGAAAAAPSHCYSKRQLPLMIPRVAAE